MAKQKTYKVIVKVGAEKFVKYHSHNLLSFVKFLDKNFTDWRYMNVYDDGLQIANFTKRNRPTSKRL